MTLSIKQTVRNSMLTTLAAALDAGSGPGKIAVYAGDRPATADAALSGNTKLVEFTLADPACEAAAGGAVALDADPDLSANASAGGTASFFRAVDSDGNVVTDGSVGTAGADLNLTTTTIASGQTVTVVSGNFAALAG